MPQNVEHSKLWKKKWVNSEQSTKLIHLLYLCTLIHILITDFPTDLKYILSLPQCGSKDTAVRDTSYCYLLVQPTMVPYIWYDGYANICMYIHTHYTLSQVYLAKELPVLVSVSLNKQIKQTILIITNSNIILLNHV